MLTAEKLRSLLLYTPETGVFTRLTGQFNGAVAGHLLSSTGNVQIMVCRKKYSAHRLAWLYMTGKWPNAQIDHINRDRSDNRWANLREATHGQNCVNRVSFARKYDLPRGVTFYRGRFLARVKGVGQKSVYLGSFDTPEAAHSAYMAAARRVHGEFLPRAA